MTRRLLVKAPLKCPNCDYKTVRNKDKAAQERELAQHLLEDHSIVMENPSYEYGDDPWEHDDWEDLREL